MRPHVSLMPDAYNLLFPVEFHALRESAVVGRRQGDGLEEDRFVDSFERELGMHQPRWYIDYRGLLDQLSFLFFTHG